MTTSNTSLSGLQSMVAEAAPQAVAAPKPQRKKNVDALGRSYATGKRKDAIARVWLKAGSGRITVNGRDWVQYFGRPTLRMMIAQPFELMKRLGQYDVLCTVTGGGLSGQAGAIRHGIGKALAEFEPDLHKALRDAGFITRDSRRVERKKFGHKKARRSFQFSKR